MSVNGAGNIANGGTRNVKGWWAFSPLRERLLLLVAVAILPAFGMIIYSAVEQRRTGKEAALHEALHLAKSGAAMHERTLSSARQLLITLSQLEEVRRLQAPACQIAFSNAIRAQPIYANIGLIDLSGLAVASHLSTMISNRSDRPYFWETTNRLDFTIGSYRISESLGKPIVSLAYPVRDSSNELVGVVYAALDLSWFKSVVTNLNLPPLSSVTVLNGNRVTLVRYPDPEHRFTGLPLEKFYPEVKTNILRVPEQGRMLNGPRLSRDGVWRLYAAAPLQGGTGDSGESSAFVTVGIPLAAAHSDTNWILTRNILLLGIVGGLTALTAWYGADLFVLRRVRRLVITAEELKSGNLETRTGARSYQGELGQLASAFDAMAESLRNRIRERESAQGEEREANRKLKALKQGLEQLVRVRTDELKRCNEELETFAHVIADDLRKPLRVITSRMLMLKRHCIGKLDGAADDYVEFAVDGATRMGKLIEDLLSYARLDSQPPAREPIPAREIVNCALRNLAVAIDEAKAEVQYGVLPIVVGDRGQLIQLFQNLIGNALKFRKQCARAEVTISGAAQEEAAVGTAVQERFFEFRVRDNGIGIAAEHYQRIFLIFQRLHTRAQYSGTGIGLSICKKIVERHGGRIWVDSKPGEGTTFHFTLPVAQLGTLWT